MLLKYQQLSVSLNNKFYTYCTYNCAQIALNNMKQNWLENTLNRGMSWKLLNVDCVCIDLVENNANEFYAKLYDYNYKP